jgi:hypothetical protein
MVLVLEQTLTRSGSSSKRFLLYNFFSLGEKLDDKYKEANLDTKQALIDRALDKNHKKAFVGLRLYHENMKLLQL